MPIPKELGGDGVARSTPTTRTLSEDRATKSSQVLPTNLVTTSAWTVATIRNTLDDHENGQFFASALLSNAVLRDPQIFAAFLTRVSALSARAGLPFKLDPSTGIDDRRASKIAKDLEAIWWTCFPEEEIARLLGDGIFLGLAVGRVAWNGWTPKLTRLRPHGLYWSEVERVFRYISGDGQNLVVTPGQNGWFLYAPFGPDSWQLGSIRALGLEFIGRTFAKRDWFRASEKHGMPALAVKEPFSASDDIEAGQGKAPGFYSQIVRLGQDGILRLPQPQDTNTPGWSADWLELKSDPFTGFQNLLAECRKEIICTLLGKDPESTASRVGGDGARLLQKVESEFLIRDASTMGNALREQVLKPWVAFNVDPALTELAPFPSWSTQAPIDLSQRATTLNTVADAITKLDALGIDVTAVLDEFHLTRVRPPVPPKDPTQ